MTEANEFIVRVMLPEHGDRPGFEKVLTGWSQVTSFGRTVFSKRVSGEEAVRVLRSVNSLGLEYSLSIDDVRKGEVVPSSPVLVGSKKLGREEARVSEVRGVRPSLRGGLPALAGWAAGSLALVLIVALGASVVTSGRDGAPAVAGTVGLFEDNFTDNRYGWVVNDTASIDSGSYSIRNSGSEKSVLLANERLTGHNLVAEVDVVLTGGEKTRFAGLGYRIRNVENFYFFGVALDGSVSILKRELGYWRRLEPGGGIRRTSDGVHLKNSYRLRMVVKGTYTEFYVDGKLITITRDESFGSGLFGFYVDGNLDAAFDDLILTFSQSAFFEADDLSRLE